MSDFLAQMAQASADRAAKADFDAGSRPSVFPLGLDRFDVIAEMKNRSPAEGRLAVDGQDRAARARCYAEAGAAAISVLTEPSRFDGELSHLEEVVRAVEDLRVPVMRKDFLVDPVQISEARAAGASGVLLILAMLDDDRLREMLDRAYEQSLFVLLEAFDAGEIARAAALLDDDAHREQAGSGSLLLGVNTRNLRTLEVERSRLQELATHLPGGIGTVAESGIADAGDAAHASRLGYSLALVGTALMRSDDPGALITSMLDAGRQGAAA